MTVQITEESLKVIRRLSVLGAYINGLSSAKSNSRLFAVVIIDGKERVCTIPTRRGKPLVLERNGKSPYPISTHALPCIVPHMQPDIDIIEELRVINDLNALKGNAIEFKYLIDLSKDRITPI